MEKISLKGNIIKYDEKTKISDIKNILEKRLEKEEFILEPSFEDLADPYLLKDMDKAVERIKKAKKNNQKVMIFWDYDVDWVTSTALLMHFFKKIWILASYRLPHRVKDGYGLKKYFIDEIKELNVDLIITVDCGTKDIDVIDYAKSLWIDVIITDHHTAPEKISKNAIAVVNPKRADCKYVYKHLAWAGVAFKLIQALSSQFFPETEAKKYIKESIDIAAIWTVADCMSLTWENRVIVTEWLKQIKNSRSKWIKKLLEDKMNIELDSDIFGFHIWPRLNAAGRIDSPYLAVNLLLNNSESINKVVREIENLNEQRKFLTKEFVNDAFSKIKKEDNIIFYVSKDIKHWIIWIVAWRITEKYNKACICLKDEWDKLVASCRSPEYFSIIEILEKYKNYFISFWWHKQAAWFSISKEKFIEFRQKILTEVNKLDFSKYKKEIKIDKIVSLTDLGFSMLNTINKFKPFWLGNPKPIFMIKNLNPEKIEFLGKWRDHLRFITKHWFKIFAFFMWDFYEEIKRSKKNIDIIFELDEDNWNWNKNLALKIIDIVLE